MKNRTFKWTSMVVAIMLSTLVTACNGQQEQNTAETAGNTEMGNGMDDREMTDMEMSDMETTQQEKVAATVDTGGEPRLVVSYMAIKNALVNDNYEQVKQGASDMLNSLEDSELNEEQRKELKNSISQITGAQDIKAQRKQFNQLSQQLYQVVQNNDLTDKALYWQHCPMAMGGKGANWLSYEEQVRNPFMGQQMPGCGSVEETIN